MSDDEGRPDPDALLKRLTAAEERSTRAKLKIFFGFAPGVGKTYAMLESARRLAAQGVEVVVGCAETHGRQETAKLLVGLEVVPRRVLPYRGTELAEFDLEGALARKPRILIVDELAHTNAPGVTHGKRYQDVLDLLDAGIEVHTTLNVQHVESLNDVVAQVTSVRVRETVPDAILDRADEIELVDLPPDELLVRLAEGKVYVPEQASRAAQNFFQRGNLLALRELALRRTADRVDVDVRAYREEHEIERTWAAAERILVCISASPASAKIIRGTRRMADRLRAPWVAAYVEAPGALPLAREAAERLEGHVRLVEALGGEVVRLTGARVSDALMEHARKHDVTRIVVGKPTHPRLRDRLRGSLVDDIVRTSGDIDVHVISGEDSTAPATPRRDEVEREPFPFVDYVGSIVVVAVTTITAALGRTVLALPDFVVLYLAGIILVGGRFGLGPSLLAASLSVAAYDFFFIPPYFTFAVADLHNVLTFLIMFATGLFIGGQTRRIKRQERHARERESRTSALYGLSRQLATSADEASAASVLATHMADHFGGGAAIFVGNATAARLRELARAGTLDFGTADEGVVKWVFEHGRAAGRGTDTLPGAHVACVPLSSAGRVLGVVAYAPREGRTITGDERNLLDAFVRQGSLALERAHLAEEAKVAALRVRAEEMRNALLSAVSHDLRTPLAVITGAATSLRDGERGLVAAQKQDLLDTVCEEAERLEHLLGNLLDMTRLESGGATPASEWVPVDELVGAALTRMERKLQGREIRIEVPSALPLVAVDPVLMEQVFVNLLENAAKYTPEGTPIDVVARELDGALVVEIGDHGAGLRRGDEERVFEKFYRGAHVGVSGVGLGLAICKAIVEAHGGTITAENRSTGGALFRIRLVLVGEAPRLAPEPVDTERDA